MKSFVLDSYQRLDECFGPLSRKPKVLGSKPNTLSFKPQALGLPVAEWCKGDDWCAARVPHACESISQTTEDSKSRVST